MKTCYLCGRNGRGDPLDGHHIFGGARRALSEKLGLVVPLCHNRCHEFGPGAAHNNAAVMERLHKDGQRMAMEKMGWSRWEFASVFGKNYLDDNEPDLLPDRAADTDDFAILDDNVLAGAPDWAC